MAEARGAALARAEDALAARAATLEAEHVARASKSDGTARKLQVSAIAFAKLRI